jgi:transportin-3
VPCQHFVPYLPQLHSFVQTVGQNLSQDDRLQVYEAIAHVISYMPMAEAALALRQFAVEILAKIEDVVVLPSPTQEEVQTVAGKGCSRMLP